MISHENYMQIALQNAQAMKGQTDPNPLVGAVIVNENRIVGIGAHLKPGEPHAEIYAIQMAGTKSTGGTLYVTLEPCSHYGRTGPCAQAIVAAGIKKVVIATIDPNPLVAGNGVKILQEAGIEVIQGVCEVESKKMNEVFNKYIVQQFPFVTLKAAVTLDGKIATASFDSKWITSEEARMDVHEMRHQHGGILVGVGTVIADNPALTTRIAHGRNPHRIIVDSSLRIPLHSNVILDGEAPTWIFTSQAYDTTKRAELESVGVKVFVTGGANRVDLLDMLRQLGEQGISSLLVEGGGEVNASFMEQGLVDKLVLYIAPKLVGGSLAPTFLGGAGREKMADAIELRDMHVSQVGKDFKFTAYPVYK